VTVNASAWIIIAVVLAAAFGVVMFFIGRNTRRPR
jgi:hypothetical protein